MVKDYIINLKSLVHQLMQISSSLQVEGISSWEVVMYKLSFPQGGNDVNNFDPKLRLPFSSKFFFFFLMEQQFTL